MSRSGRPRTTRLPQNGGSGIGVVVTHPSVRVGAVAFPRCQPHKRRCVDPHGVVAVVASGWHLFAAAREVRDLRAGANVRHDFVERGEPFERVLGIEDAALVDVTQVVLRRTGA